MKKHRSRLSMIIIVGILLTACSNQNNFKTKYNAKNDIVSYKPVDEEKTVITLGKYSFFKSEMLEATIEKKFPTVDIVVEEEAPVSSMRAYFEYQGEHDGLPDIVFNSFLDSSDRYFYDLSAEEFTSRYHLSSLNNLSKDGKVYQLPVSSTVRGIMYNKTLFKEHGWEIPATLDEFYALCDNISKSGVRPFVPCLKYSIDEFGLGLSSREVFSSVEQQTNYKAFIQGERSCKGILEPYYEALRKLYDQGLVVESDFSSSLTQNRHALYDGKIAMLPCDLNMFSLYEDENPNCEVDFIGYFTNTPNERWMQMVPGRNVALSKQGMQDPNKKEILLDILDYLSTSEGQDALFDCFAGVSSLKSYQNKMTDSVKDVKDCMEQGRIFFADPIGTTNNNPVVKDYMMGKMTLDEILEATDQFATWDALAPLKEEAIGSATETFTMLETSMFIAEHMKKETNADVALLLHNSYYKANTSMMYQGEIRMPDRFYLRGLNENDALTTYQISGKNLKKLMEHPIINGEEVNAMYAFSGLKMTYAPWKDINENVVQLTLEDGTTIQDDKLYTVAAWATSIDPSYLTSTVTSYPNVGNNVTFMTKVIKTEKEITPIKDDRLTLQW